MREATRKGGEMLSALTLNLVWPGLDPGLDPSVFSYRYIRFLQGGGWHVK